MAKIYDTFGRKFGSQREREPPPSILDFEVKSPPKTHGEKRFRDFCI
jgi:hypothetical protein